MRIAFIYLRFTFFTGPSFFAETAEVTGGIRTVSSYARRLEAFVNVNVASWTRPSCRTDTQVPTLAIFTPDIMNTHGGGVALVDVDGTARARPTRLTETFVSGRAVLVFKTYSMFTQFLNN